ncbi:MAG: GNAT family N-acetyltransferase [Gammaproteobacteria bacterium]
MKDIRIRKTDWASDGPALSAIRRQVFIEEQKVPEDMAWDEEDATGTHFIADTPDGQAVGCTRLLPGGQISRLSVLENRRSEGIGRALLDAALAEAAAQGLREVFLHAQTHATSFYEASGFSVDGGIFLEAGIPHRLMVKILPLGASR